MLVLTCLDLVLDVTIAASGFVALGFAVLSCGLALPVALLAGAFAFAVGALTAGLERGGDVGAARQHEATQRDLGRAGGCAHHIREEVRPARGDNAVSYAVLRTERGLNRLLERGALTPDELSLLDHFPEKARHHAVLEWILARFVEARKTGLVYGGAGLDARFLEEGCKLRAVCASIVDDASARMPLSYVHLVQLLVDTLVVLAPFALYPKLGVLTVLLSSILVIFYRGFLQLSKSFLDPWGNDGSEAQNVNIDVLLAEVYKDTPLWAAAAQSAPIEWPA